MLTWENKETGEKVDSETAWKHHVETDQYLYTPRWNGLPARWYSCAFCSFQIQLGARLGEGTACGRYIVHECPGGCDRDQSGKTTHMAMLSAPWRAIQWGLSYLHGN